MILLYPKEGTGKRRGQRPRAAAFRKLTSTRRETGSAREKKAGATSGRTTPQNHKRKTPATAATMTRARKRAYVSPRQLNTNPQRKKAKYVYVH